MNRIARVAMLAGVLFSLSIATRSQAGESWDAIYLRNTQVGNIHLHVQPLKDSKGREVVRVQVEWNLNLRRGKDVTRLSLRYGTIETPEGQVLRLDTRNESAQQVQRVYGDVKDGVMVLTTDGGGQKTQKEIAWGDDVRGPYGAEMSLTREPLAVGQIREVKTFIPELNKICTTKLTAEKKEDVLYGGRGQKRELLRVKQEVIDPDGKAMPEMDSTLWVDETGQILKAHSEMLGGMDIIRTTRAAATAESGVGGMIDLIGATVIKTPRPIPNFINTRSIVYRVTMPDDDPSKVFVASRRQKVNVGDDRHSATVEVTTSGPNIGDPQDEPGPEYLRASPLINSQDSLVLSHTRKALAGVANDQWSQAVAIEEWVANNLRNKNFGVAFASAAEVAKNLSGDCTEHSVLVAAMCRAAGIPSRCAVGLVYADENRGFGGHMWNEVYVNRRWVAIDAAYRQSEVDATHLLIGVSSLDGTSGPAAFLPVLRVLGMNITIEPVEIR